MDVFDVPRQDAVEQRVEDQHHHHAEQVILITLDRRDVDVTPLYTDALYLVVCKVLRPETERGRREERLCGERNEKFYKNIKHSLQNS